MLIKFNLRAKIFEAFQQPISDWATAFTRAQILDDPRKVIEKIHEIYSTGTFTSKMVGRYYSKKPRTEHDKLMDNFVRRIPRIVTSGILRKSRFQTPTLSEGMHEFSLV